MKISKTLLLPLCIVALSACEKNQTDTANPDDAATPAQSESDDFMDEVDPMADDEADAMADDEADAMADDEADADAMADEEAEE